MRLGQHQGSAAHRFHAACHEQFSFAYFHRIRSVQGRGQAGGTQSVDRQSANLNGHPCKQRGEASNIPAIFTGLVCVTGNNILKGFLREIIFFDYRSDDMSQKIVWSNRRKGTCMAPEGRSDAVVDKRIV